MKRSVLLLLVIFSVIIISCDKVTHPYENTSSSGGPLVGNNFVTRSNAAVSNSKKVLLEDYTGAYCGNCPPAAIVAQSLAAQYSPSVVAIAVHGGFYAWKHGLDYPGTFSTSIAEEWDGSATGFGVSFVGNPNGMVNRKNFPGDGLIQSNTKWPTTVLIALQDPFYVKLDVVTKYDSMLRALNAEIKATFKTTYTNNINVCAVIIEDGIIGHQKDYSKNPDLVQDYEFDHMLRAGMNGNWGGPLKSAPVAVNDSAKVTVSGFSLDTQYNDKQVSVVVFAYDAVTKEVLQVEKVKIR